MLKVYIVDDEPLARDELRYLLLRSKLVEITGEAASFEEALEQISAYQPDLVFVDIEMTDQNGLQLAKRLQELNPIPSIVFATAYDEFALQAFDLGASDYILKPFDEKRIQQTIEKIILQKTKRNHAISTNPKRIAVSLEGRILLIDCDSILYMTSADGKCTIFTDNQAYTISETLTMLEKKLSGSMFLRVHRSYLVNVEHISEIEPWFNSTYNITMKNGVKVPVSRTYVKDLKELIGF
ncbi:LytTR family transcriptional regulator DNA-binding domain-containing protein [Peribacillus sp. FSL H8-0477]|uniref:LytR/AlgR family response regulator transcription factor n=1 Tax=Peribacillus sp. FSL H8-0477 TaxID=2921388 RepID=UPI0030F7D9C7